MYKNIRDINKYFNTDFYAFQIIFGIICSIKLVIIGDIFIGELLFTLFFINKYLGGGEDKFDLRFFKSLAISYSGVLLLTGLRKSIDYSDMVKGVLPPVLFYMTVMGLLIYFNKNKKIIPSFLLGSLIGWLYTQYSSFSEAFSENYWKFGLGFFVINAINLMLSFFYKYKNSFYIIVSGITMSGISFTQSSRSSSFILLTSIFLYLIRLRVKYNKKIIIKYILISILSLFILNIALSSFMQSDLVESIVDYEVFQKYRLQANSEYGLLLGGRSEILTSLNAFMDSPIFGHGIGKNDPTGKYISNYALIIDNLVEEKIDVSSLYEQMVIPTHSFIMNGFVTAGIIGGFYWLYLVYFVLNNFIKYIRFIPYFFYFEAISFIWSVFFSPFGANNRWPTSIFLASFIIYIHIIKTDENFNSNGIV